MNRVRSEVENHFPTRRRKQRAQLHMNIPTVGPNVDPSNLSRQQLHTRRDDLRFYRLYQSQEGRLGRMVTIRLPALGPKQT